MTLATKTAALAAFVIWGNGALADGHAAWTLDPALSAVSFGSIKNDSVGESHGFGEIAGFVGADGAVTVTVDLTSVETNIDIRNERMIENVFGSAATAELTAAVDMAAMEALSVGEAMTTEVDGTLGFLGDEIPLYVNMFIMRTSDDQVVVTTDGMAFLTTEEAGIDAGISVLQELAGLDSITRVVPITLRLIFDAG